MNDFRELLWKIHDKLNSIVLELNEMAIQSDNEDYIKRYTLITIEIEKIINKYFY